MNRRPRGPSIPRAVDAALREFVNALHKSAMYPPQHRFVAESSSTLVERLSLAMAERDEFTLGITPKGLLLDGAALEPLPAMLRDLASKLHRKNIGMIQILRGVSRDDVMIMLSALSAADADKNVGRTGLRLDRLRIEPMVYDVLAYGDVTLDTDLDDVFWAQLVEAAFGRKFEGGEAMPSSGELAEAIAVRVAASAESARRVFEALASFSSALTKRADRASGSARRRFVEVLSGLSRATTTRVVSAAPTPTSRRRFLRETLELVPPVLLMQLLESVAEADGEPISPQLRWLLGKLAGTEGPSEEPATGAFASEVIGIVETWEGISIEDDEEDDPRLGLEPARVLAIGLELHDASETVCHAARTLADRGQLIGVLELLDSPLNQPEVVKTVAETVLEPGLLARLLSAPVLDFPLITRVVDYVGVDAVGPLLDALAAADDRTARRRLLDTLVQVGQPAERELLRRLAGAPWYLARNILAALGQLPAISDTAPLFSALGSDDVRVRHEALKALLRQPESRERAASEAMLGGEEVLIRTAMGSLADDCPPAVVGSVIAVLSHPNEELRLQAIRLLADSNNPLVVPQLLRLVRTTGGFFRRTKLLPKSRTTVAALEVLARRWANHRPVLTVLQLAERSSDPEIRAALGHSK